MLSLGIFQERLRGVCFDRAPSAADFASLGDDSWRWEVYRRIVRQRLREVVGHAFARLRARLGGERFDAIVARWLASAPPRSPHLRDVPGEMLAWLESNPSALRAFDAAPFALDLARFEWAELAVAYAADGPRGLEDGCEVGELAMDRTAILAAAHVRLDLVYPVHRLADDAIDLAPSPVPLCLYRDHTPLDVQTLELSPTAAAIVDALARGRVTLTRAVEVSAARHGAAIDAPFVEALSEVLADFVERGLVLGSAVPMRSTQ